MSTRPYRLRKASRTTMRCAQYIDINAVLKKYGGSPAYILRHGGPTSRSLLGKAVQNFSSVWKGIPSVSRYSDGSYNVLYTATKSEVAKSERMHWLVKLVFRASPIKYAIPFLVYSCSVKGAFVDLTRGWKRKKKLVHPTKYDYCHQVARKAMLEGADYLLAPSARKLGGCCVPVFIQSASRTKSVVESFDAYWDARKRKVYTLSRGNKKYVSIDNVYRLV
jgi:RES domain-containing protein